MKITGCYIVKNEENNIGKSIESLRSSVDEIIVVDTGSTDDTKKIALRCGAIVYDYVWDNDFSAPRNFALDKATGEWIIFLDGDEYFSKETARNIRAVIQKYENSKRYGCLLIHRYDIDVDNSYEVLADTLMVRIFYHNPHYRYEGIIHEELLENGRPITELYVIEPEELKLIHTGYSASMSKEKAERNLRLLLKELTVTDNPGRLYMYLADAYLGLGDREKAKYYAQKDIAQGRRATTYASRSYRILLQLSLEEGESLSNRLKLCWNAVHDFPENPEFRADLAECLAALEDYAQAATEMELALDNYHNYKGIEPMLFTAEQAELAQQRMQGWREKMSKVDLVKIAELLRMLLLPLLLMNDDEYNQANKEYENVLPKGFYKVLQRYHGDNVLLQDDCAREYLDILDMLIARKNTEAMEKLLAASGDFSAAVRKDIVERLDKKIAQEEFSREEVLC